MNCIITGDIKGSRKAKTVNWLAGLKNVFIQVGKTPTDWEIYRGDEFQLEVKNCEEALLIAFQIKAYLRSIKLDARMSIGLGDKTFKAKKISESNGSAFVHSGIGFEQLKKNKTTLSITSSNIVFDKEMNLILKLGLSFMDHWLAQPAEFVLITIQNPTLSQEEIGLKLGINQAAVSRRRKRANFDLVLDINTAFIEKLKMFQI